MLFPYNLHWDDLDPGRHPFDPDGARAAVEALAPDPGFSSHPDWGWERWMSAEWFFTRWPDDMTNALTRYYGAWACGWRWVRNIEEGWISGPVSVWADSSVAGEEEALSRVADALLEWRLFLEDLAGRFVRLPTSGAPRERAFQRAAADIITHVADWTGANDVWYETCARVLRWYLSHLGVPAERSGALIDGAIGGRFESWTAPGPDAVDEAAGRLAAGLAHRDDD
ncbi:hypothetical protein [Actinoallomurus acaciae]|uniref:Uncharacterized protein n=1 Tax=Actinoallomurus acaciae TaxID=502577 RepID=A0ABV5YJL5_9ACTN